MASAQDFSIYKERRDRLIDAVKKRPEATDTSVILLAANFEAHDRFVQESSFFYFTGLNEPGIVCVLHMDGTQHLFIPNCMQERKKWVNMPFEMDNSSGCMLGFDSIVELGNICKGYSIAPFSPQAEYKNVQDHLVACIDTGGKIFTTDPKSPSGYVQQRLLLIRLMQWMPALQAAVHDCSPQIAALRQAKSHKEIETIFKAVQITAEAHAAAAQALADGVSEAEVQATIEYVMTANNARIAFPSIVGSGPNAAVLHYCENNRTMRNGDMVVIDIGASYGHYAADITRTYPVNGEFTERQKEVYEVVLKTQAHIAEVAQVGYYLRSNEHPEKSLHHIAQKFLEENGFGGYMPHGIGHYLGLDVHDVGNYTEPLKVGDVFTIEPGIYIKEESIGVRIEDNYWMTEKGLICLSEDLPKSVKEIQELVKKKSK
jgi:Xaa-Pro aminopeptidase